MRWLLAILLAQAAAPRAKPYTLPPLTSTTLGGVKGTGSALVCSGTDKVTGFDAAGTLQCGADAGGAGGTPGGVSGNVQVNDGAGGFGAYAGTSCAYALKTLTASGVATCTAAPTIPTDISGEQYWTAAASANLSAEKSLAGFTALVLDTAGTPSGYAGTSCTNQFPRSLNGSGAASCATVAFATDTSGTVGVTRGGSGLTTVAADQVYVGTAADMLTAKALPSCSTAATSKLLYDTGTHAFSCGTDQTSAGGGYDTIQDNGSAETQRTTLNLISGSNISATCADNAGATKTDCTFAIAGPVTLANGGTNANLTASNGAIPYSDASKFVLLAPGTAGQVLVSGGAGAPTWGNGCVTLGTANGATTTVGPVTWTGTYSNVYANYEIVGYNGGTPIGRVLVGSASISTTALTNGTSAYEGVAGTLTSTLSKPGAPLAVTASAIARGGTVHFFGRSGALKNYEIEGANGTPSVSVARTLYRGVGSFSDLGTNLPLQRAQLTVYDSLAATAASAQTFLSGTTITVIGCP